MANITTKYSIGDVVYYLLNDKINHSFIRKIQITLFVGIKDLEEIYEVYSDNKAIMLSGDRLFKTKEDLLDSLKDSD